MATGYCVRRHFGLEIAHSLASAGCDLVITSRTLADAEASAALLAEEHQVKALGLALDVSDFSSVEQAAAAAIADMGKIDILVNNAGGGSGPGANVGGIFDRSNEAVESLIQANLMGSFWCCKVFGEHMVSQGYGKIINTSSMYALGGNTVAAHYSAAKSALSGLTNSLARELAPWNIMVNAVAPGFVLTGMTSPGRDEAGLARRIEQVPLKRMAGEFDIAYTVAFLASEEADFITGQVISPNGGERIVGI